MILLPVDDSFRLLSCHTWPAVIACTRVLAECSCKGYKKVMSHSSPSNSVQNLAFYFNRSIAILLLHGALLFSLGTLLSYHQFTLPLWVTASLVLLWVPKDLRAHWRELANAQADTTRTKLLLRRCAALVALSLPYVLCPGQLFAYPVSDLGFRFLFGNRLQAGVVKFMVLPQNQAFLKEQTSEWRLDTKPMPHGMQEWRGLLPNSQRLLPGHVVVLATGESPLRHIDFINGDHDGEWGLLVGGPSFVLDLAKNPNYARRMWPGVYYYCQPGL